VSVATTATPSTSQPYPLTSPVYMNIRSLTVTGLSFTVELELARVTRNQVTYVLDELRYTYNTTFANISASSCAKLNSNSAVLRCVLPNPIPLKGQIVLWAVNKTVNYGDTRPNTFFVILSYLSRGVCLSYSSEQIPLGFCVYSSLVVSSSETSAQTLGDLEYSLIAVSAALFISATVFVWCWHRHKATLPKK
jgi:hypothetical protein